ncbi:conserved hypothetical protein [Theileria orientalis strain Shintoku]|uniref:Uncharacterized protein n=1 Tax=Theileria orientalis strain Shintoku TaxID=869250 RepID=J4C9A8_THEOR|nr:conserved hypothetical protein [Theileria orientalis strain Shintoku]BAM42213.1 conserved hypothetical protein [Theileria orientalis strain Shintoku]|eukprot:XP_009692514.1 conserved hypothetical protein [Theileria orientalis strain Shintoku]
MTISTADWEKKWRLMIDKDNNKKIQNEIFGENLRDKKECEESIECTFQPNLTKSYQPGYRPKRSKDALVQLLLPIISDEESILMELRRIEREEENRRRELRDVIVSSFSRFPGKSTDHFLDFYREERLNDICSAKNLKLEVVGKLQELERRFNVLCTSESISASELKRVGFDIEKCKSIKKELLRSLDNHESLKSRCRVSREFDEIVRSLDRQRRSKSYGIAEGRSQRDSHNGNGTNLHSDQNAIKMNHGVLNNKTISEDYHKGQKGNKTQNYANVDNHYGSPSLSNPYFNNVDTNKLYNGGNGQYQSPQMSHQNPYFNQIRSNPPNYQLVDNYLDRNRLNNQWISGYQMANQPPMYSPQNGQHREIKGLLNRYPISPRSPLANQPPIYSPMANPIKNQSPMANPIKNQSPISNPIKNQSPTSSQFSNQQLIMGPKLSRNLQEPVKHTYGLNRPRYPGIPSSNGHLTTNLNYHKGNLGNYRQFPRMEHTNPFLVK